MAASSASASAEATATSELQSSLRELHIGEKTSSITDIARPKLTANTSVGSKNKKKKAPAVADSWEDDFSDDDGGDAATNKDKDTGASASANGRVPDDELASPSLNKPDSLGTSPAVAEGPLDPPPTPISPQTSQPWVSSGGGYGPTSTSSRSRSTSASTNTAASARDPNRRPEKQTAVAGRLIAGALGIRAPKRTEEQRAYDRSVKEQEIRRKNREKEEAAKLKEEEEKAKASVWDD